MNHTFSDIVGKIKYHAKNKEQGYKIPLALNYNEKIGNITPGVYTVLSGLPSAGTTSFVDVNYVMNVLIQWYFSSERKPLKLFYFSMVDGEVKKLQSLLCCYLRLMFNISVDIPTLNSQPGRKFDIDKEDTVLNALDDAQLFFDEVINEGALEIMDGSQPPSVIYNTVVDYMSGIGVDKSGEAYKINDDFADGLVLVIVDKTDRLMAEADQYSATYGNDLNVKFDHYMNKLKTRYNVSPVVITPAINVIVRSPKDTEPHYKQLGIYGKNCDRGVMLYNPIAENNISRFLGGADELDFFVINGKNTLRYWSIVRNSEGIDSIKERMLFLPGSSFMVEHPIREQVTSQEDVGDVILDFITPYVDMRGLDDQDS